MTAEDRLGDAVGPGTYDEPEATTTRDGPVLPGAYEAPGSVRAPRHPCAVTASRLEDHLARYEPHVTPTERLAAEYLITVLDGIEHRERAARLSGVDRA